MTLHCSLPVALLPPTEALHLETIAIAPDQITATLVACQPVACCPLCGSPSRRIHRHDPRTLADLPWGTRRVRLDLTMRKFFCDSPTCGRRSFTARLPAVVAPYKRRGEPPCLGEVSCDPAKNRRRFYDLRWQPTLFGERALVRVWGRQGQPGTVRATLYPDRDQAQPAIRQLVRRRVAHGSAVLAWQSGAPPRRATGCRRHGASPAAAP